MNVRFVDLSMFPGVDIKTFKVKSLDGHDLIAAAARCTPMEGETMDNTLFGVSVRQQQIAQSVIEVNGEQVRGPCMDFLKWNSRTREFVAMAYNSLNEITDAERELFQKALAGSAEESVQPRQPESPAGG